MKYILVEWPESQNYMEFPWFQEECHLCIAISSAYFIPEERYNQVNNLNLKS